MRPNTALRPQQGVDEQRDTEGESALIAAAAQGMHRVVECLLSNNADANSCDGTKKVCTACCSSIDTVSIRLRLWWHPTAATSPQ